MNDGMVYSYNGVYAMTNKSNRTYQIIIVMPEQTAITLIDTKEASKSKPQLLNKINTFLAALHRVIVDITGKEIITMVELPDHTLDDILEQIIKDNSI